MNNNPNQPRKDDAVKGGQTPPPVAGVVLGGIEGVKRRLTNPVVEVRIAALSEALNYGESGLDLIIGVLQDNSEQVQREAGLLLRKSAEVKAKQALIEHDPWLFFTTFANWKHEEFNPQIGITDPVSTAYALTIPYTGNHRQTVENLFKLLLQKPQSNKIEALLCKYGRHSATEIVVNALVNAKEKLANLKALYIGDMHDYEYKTSDVTLSNMTPILAAYPNLELLQVRGFGSCYERGLSFDSLRHPHLKTLIVETGYMLSRQIIDQICGLELPALEYLELWLGQDEYYYPSFDYREDYLREEYHSIENSALVNLMPIISGKAFPELKYLGLRSSNYSNDIAEAIVRSPLLERLIVLDLSMGTLTNKGAEILLNCPAIERLHTLNVARNLLPLGIVEQLSQLKCRVVAEPQAQSSEDRYYTLSE